MLICHIYIACSIQSQTIWVVKLCFGPGSLCITVGASGQSAYQPGRCNFAYAVVKSICHIYIACSIQSQTKWVVKLCFGPGSLGITWCATCQSAYQPGRRYFTDAVVISIRHIHIAGRISSHTRWVVKLCFGPGSLGITFCASCQSTYRPGRGNFADAVIFIIRHIYIAGSIRGHTVGVCKLRCRPVSLCIAVGASSQSAYLTGRCNFPYTLVFHISNIYIAGSISGHTSRTRKLCCGPGPVGITSCASSQSAYQPGRRNFAYAVVIKIRHIYIAGRIRGHTGGVFKLRCRPGTLCIADGASCQCAYGRIC